LQEFPKYLLNTFNDDDKKKYNQLLHKHRNKISNNLAHNDSKTDNWVDFSNITNIRENAKKLEFLIDFGISTYGSGASDVEMVLIEQRQKDRDKYYNQYFKIRNYLANGLDSKTFDYHEQIDFKQEGRERAFLDFVRLETWYYQKNNSKMEEYKKSREYYQSKLV